MGNPHQPVQVSEYDFRAEQKQANCSCSVRRCILFIEYCGGWGLVSCAWDIVLCEGRAARRCLGVLLCGCRGDAAFIWSLSSETILAGVSDVNVGSR